MDLRTELLHRALTYPGAWQDHPWEDDLVVKVRKKIFVFLGSQASPAPRAGLKLTASLHEALQFPGVQPSAYGLGRHGWVQVALGSAVPRGLLMDWLDESYRAVAPKTLAAQLTERS